MRIVSAIIVTMFCFIACISPTSPKNGSQSGPIITATISDGTGSFSVHGKTTVSDWSAGLVQVDIAGIETTAPLRQINVIIYCSLTDVGVALPLNLLNSTTSGQGLYTNASASSMAYGGPTATTGGTITFDKLAMGTNTISGTFSFTAVQQSTGASVSVSNGTFGK